MRRISQTFFTFLALCLIIAGTALARGRHGVNININHDDDDLIASCDDLNVRFDHEPAVMTSEDVKVGALRSLRVRNAYNGGIRVVGASESTFTVTACKAAATPASLSKIRVSLRDTELVVDGPEDGDWTIFFLIRAPQNSTLDLATTNGEIAVRDFTGTLTGRAKNGPVTMRNASGTIDVQSVNGPVSLTGGSGTVKLASSNGPLSVKLSSTRWQGSLSGSTQNGPLSVKIPRGYRTGMVVESLGHGPISCRASACADARRTWSDDEDERRIEIGDAANANVRLSTVNGPLSIKESD